MFPLLQQALGSGDGGHVLGQGVKGMNANSHFEQSLPPKPRLHLQVSGATQRPCWHPGLARGQKPGVRGQGPGVRGQAYIRYQK